MSIDLGNTHIGTGGLEGTGAINCTMYTSIGSGGTAFKMNTRMNYNGAANTLVTAVYSNNGGEPGTKLAESSQAVVDSDNWFETNISFTVQPSTDYWLCAWTSDNNTDILYDSPGGTDQMKTSVSGTWPTWPAWSTSTAFARLGSIYVTYTEDSGTVVLMGDGIT